MGQIFCIVQLRIEIPAELFEGIKKPSKKPDSFVLNLFLHNVAASGDGAACEVNGQPPAGNPGSSAHCLQIYDCLPKGRLSEGPHEIQRCDAYLYHVLVYF